MSIKKHKIYKKMLDAVQGQSSIKKEFIGDTITRIEWTFMHSKQMYVVKAYKIISSYQYGVSYGVNVFKNNENVAHFTGPGKARKLIEHAMAAYEKSR